MFVRRIQQLKRRTNFHIKKFSFKNCLIKCDFLYSTLLVRLRLVLNKFQILIELKNIYDKQQFILVLLNIPKTNKRSKNPSHYRGKAQQHPKEEEKDS